MRLCLNYILFHRMVEGEGKREGEGSIHILRPLPLTGDGGGGGGAPVKVGSRKFRVVGRTWSIRWDFIF